MKTRPALVMMPIKAMSLLRSFYLRNLYVLSKVLQYNYMCSFRKAKFFCGGNSLSLISYFAKCNPILFIKQLLAKIRHKLISRMLIFGNNTKTDSNNPIAIVVYGFFHKNTDFINYIDFIKGSNLFPNYRHTFAISRSLTQSFCDNLDYFFDN